MDNQELLNQVLAAMQEQTEVLTKMIHTQISESEAKTAQKIQDLETRISLKIENDIIPAGLHSLVDGYKLTHEKQWELEKRTQDLQDQISDLQTRLAALENKTA